MHFMDKVLSVLAEPNRLKIVELLRGGPRPVGEIAKLLKLSQPHTSKHLRVLSSAGLVGSHPNAQQRIYSLQARPFKELGVWLDTFADVWTERMDSFDNYLKAMQKGANNHDSSK